MGPCGCSINHSSGRECAVPKMTIRDNEDLFRLVVNTAPVLIWISGTDKLCTYFNEPWLDFTGRSMGEELGNGWAQGVHRDDLQRCIDTYNQAFDRREEFRMEYRLRRYDGEYRWILDIGVPRYDEDRSFAGYMGSCIDVTERKLADEVRFRYAAIMESSDDAIMGLDTNGIITNWNKGAEQLYGYSAKDAIGRNISFLSPAVFSGDWLSVLDNVLKGGVLRNYETMGLRKDGARVEVSLTASPIVDAAGQIVGVSGIAHDITERKRAEETLRESEEKFRNVFRDAGVGMVIVSPEGYYLAANRTFCDYLGYTEYELFGKTVESITFPEDWPAFSQKLGETLKKGRHFRWVEKRCLHKSGRIVYTETSASVIRNRQGDPQYFVAEVLDVTKRKEAEEALSGMTRKLVEAQEQERARIARELHDDISQRLAMLAIEIEQAQDHRSERPSGAPNRAQELSMRAKEISSDLQALSHELHSSKLDNFGVVAGMKSWCNEFGERQGMEIEFKSCGSPNSPPPEISLCVFRVLQEALHNAAKHSGVKRIDVQLREASGEIQLTVSDSGKGFDMATAMQSRGLGVTSMQERVRLVGGTIVINSKEPGGTTIHVRVPYGTERFTQRVAV
jgi:PAS domain S-box-containing protein